MRIGIDARYLGAQYNGVGKYSENLLTHLSQIDEDNEYVVFVHNSLNRRLRVGENFEVVPCKTPALSTRTLLTWGNRVRRARCDFLHSLAPSVPLWGVERSILTIHDLQPFVIEEETRLERDLHAWFTRLFHRLTFPHFVRQATWLIAVSHATKGHLSHLFPQAEHKTLVIHSGVEEVFRQPPEATIMTMVTRRLDLPDNYLLYIGSARPAKNIPRMLRAFERAVRKHPDKIGGYSFLMALGSDHENPEVLRTIRELGLQERVRVLGPVTEEEKRVLYTRASVLFSVTRGEGFGLPIVEAQASGVPVVAGNDAAVPEVTGPSACLVDPLDEDAITDMLCQVLLNAGLRERLSIAGKASVERYSWTETARKVREIYDLLM